MDTENKILFDWFSFTDKISSKNDIINLLGMADISWQELPGVMGIHGFTNRCYFGGISIHYGGCNFIWVEMSGQGCRTFESLGNCNYNQLFSFCLSYPDEINITRLDVAFDDFSGLIDIKSVVNDTLEGNYVSRSNKYEVILSDSGTCIVHGKRRSNIMIRIYDKAAERKRSDEIKHWVRVEQQLRRENAAEFIRLYLVENETLEHLYFVVLNNYLRYVKQTTDSNIWRAPMTDYWYNFINYVNESVSLFKKPGTDYNTLKLNHFVCDMAGGAIFTFIRLYGAAKLIHEVNKYKPKLNPKYKLLLSESEEFCKVGAKFE